MILSPDNMIRILIIITPFLFAGRVLLDKKLDGLAAQFMGWFNHEYWERHENYFTYTLFLRSESKKLNYLKQMEIKENSPELGKEGIDLSKSEVKEIKELQEGIITFSIIRLAVTTLLVGMLPIIIFLYLLEQTT